MNILRTIKIKTLTEDLDEKELFFFSFFNDLEFIEHKNKLKNVYLLRKDDYNYFYYDITKNEFWCSYEKVWCHFDVKYNMTYMEIVKLVKSILEKHLDIIGVTPKRIEDLSYDTLMRLL